MTCSIVYRCDAPECPVTEVVPLSGPGALMTPAGWIVLGSWDDYYHACSPACTAVVARTRGVRPVSRRRRREA